MSQSNARTASVTRKTNETEITMQFALDGKGVFKGSSGIAFFDHMLNSLCRFAMIDTTVSCVGDIAVDGHHTVEDIGICMGLCIKEAFLDKARITRIGSAFVPMDEALAFVCLDISGRALLRFEASFSAPMIGGYDSQLTQEFFRALCTQAGITLHMQVPYGQNDHHKTEALFKAFGLALDQAKQIDSRKEGIPSTKGAL